MKKKSDVKFIIYQSLYIFIICVVAIKGASIDLVEVEERRMKQETIVEVDTLDNIILSKSVFASYVRIDPATQLIVSKEEYEKDPSKYTPVTVSSVGPIYTTNNPDPVTKIDELPDPNIQKPDKDIKINILDYANKLNLTQYTSISVNNPFDAPMEFAGKTIQPKSASSFTLGDESSIMMKVGTSTATIGVKPNQKPQISFSRMTTMNEDTKATTLQRTTCYRITITDDFPGQLNIKFSNGVTVKEVGKLVYDVQMNAFGSVSSFDNFTDGKTSPYSLGFTVTVTDKIAKHVITGQQQFVFGEW
ncbi:MAG: hypothetical protein EHM58_17455 [Ignavibacteriae bacterium]|nr:MAG: hypothetical protein EHM58_17455 [Ignavibacteriota bacterium]